LVAATGPRHTAFDREVALESCRARKYPNLPSRLKCLFCFPTEEEAIQFKEAEPAGFANHILYRVAMSGLGEPFMPFIGDVRAQSIADLDWPERYWRDGKAATAKTTVLSPPAVGAGTKLREILISGAARIEALL
jgi:hypothetical protein